MLFCLLLFFILSSTTKAIIKIKMDFINDSLLLKIKMLKHYYCRFKL